MDTKQKILIGLKSIVGDVTMQSKRLTLVDSMKIDFLLNNINKISLEQLESLVK